MSKFILHVKRFSQNEDGATMVEYGLMLGLIALVCIGTITVLGGEAEGLFTANGDALTNALG